MTAARSRVLEIFAAALRRVDGRAAVQQALAGRSLEPCAVLALGKAADAMLQGAAELLGERLASALLITKHGHADRGRWRGSAVRVLESSHPVPDASSLAAGRELLGFVSELPRDLPLLALISGGASALVEVPLPGVTLEQLRRANAWLLASGLPIGEINKVRKSLSTIKGGGLLACLGDRPVLGLLISDVPGDDPASIGSGLLVPTPPGVLPDLPDWLAALVGTGESPDFPGAAPELVLVATLADALAAAATAAAQAGLAVHRHTAFLEGEAAVVGRRIASAGFVPIGFARSSAGEYTFTIFAVVAMALIVSWLVAVTFAPVIGMSLLKTPKNSGEPEKPGALMRGYAALLRGAMKAKWLTIAVAIMAFGTSVYLVRFVPAQFFPSSDRPELVVDLTLRQNASIFASEAVAKRVEEALAQDEDVEHWSTYIGRGAIRFYLPLNVQLANPFFAQVVVVAKGFEERLRVQDRLEKLLAEEFPDVVSRVSPLELGPPVGWPIQYRVSGPDKDEVTLIAQRVAQAVAASSGTRHVNFDWMEPARQLRLQIDQDQARQLGVSSATIASVLNAAIGGSTVTQVRDDIYLVNVIARAVDEERASVDTLRSLQVPIPGGRTVALSRFASLEYGEEYPLVWRRDRVPTLTVRADTVSGVLPDTIVAELEQPISGLAATLPPGYRIDLGGIAEESAISQASVFAVVPLMILLMVTVLMFQLNKFRSLFVVLAVLPLSIVGVILSLLVFNRPLGFVAMLGILALIGMIAKNAVILVVQIEADRAEGKNVWDAVVAAASSRFRPLSLAAVSTILGLIPIAPTVFWGPMAFAIMGGLLLGTLLMLVFLPTLYWTVFGGEQDKPAPGSPRTEATPA